jgi:hypothetical protein
MQDMAEAVKVTYEPYSLILNMSESYSRESLLNNKDVAAKAFIFLPHATSVLIK